MSAPTTPPPARVRTALRAALVLLLAAAAALAFLVVRHVDSSVERETAAGDVVSLAGTPYGQAAHVWVPGRDVVISVGLPVERLDYSPDSEDTVADDGTYERSPDLVTAPQGGRLLPVTWKAFPRPGLEDTPENPSVRMRVVSGEQRVTVWSPQKDAALNENRSFAVALAGQPELSDVVIEVEFDGVVQRVHPASGEVEVGAAEGLYDQRTLASHCEEVYSDCDFAAVSPGQRYLPSRAGFIASRLTLSAYDRELGWAEEGTHWAATQIQVFGGTAFDASGATYFIPDDQATQVSLTLDDGSDIASTINQVETRGGAGRVVFAVPIGSEPSDLVLRQRARLEGADRPMPLTAQVPLG